MDTKRLMAEAANKLGAGIEFGLLRKTGVLKFVSASSAKDVLGFDYVVHWDDGCFEFYAANPPLSGMSQPMPVMCPYGLEVFNDYNIDYKKAIDIFHSGDWGDRFTLIVLCKPLVYPPAKEPYWYFRSNLGVNIMIGANSGDVVNPA